MPNNWQKNLFVTKKILIIIKKNKKIYKNNLVGQRCVHFQTHCYQCR